MWYPELELEHNPFVFTDRATERNYQEEVKLIPNEASRLVKRLIDSKQNAIITGERGVGKSTALEIVAEEYGYISVIGASSLKDIAKLLLRQSIVRSFNDKKYRDWINSRGIIYIEQHFETYFKRVGQNHFPHLKCNYERCRRVKRCETIPLTPLARKEGFQKLKSIFPSDINCPLRQELTAEFFAVETIPDELQNYVFLFDVPDEVAEIGGRYFKDFIENVQTSSKGTVILMATNRQYQQMQKTEFFSRFMQRDFPELTLEEMKKIFKTRIGNGNKFLEEKALNYLIESSGRNPRRFLKACIIVVQKMRDEKRKSPASLDFVMRTVGDVKMRLTEADAIERVLDELYKLEIGWIKTSTIADMMWNKYKVKISVKRLGRILKKRGLTHRANPYSEYKIFGG